MKKILALAAVAVATVAGASTNYAERVARFHNPAYVVVEMTRDSELAAELNAPRFGKADKILAEIGMDVEWEFIQSRILGDTEVAEVRTRLLDGEIPFTQDLQNKLCIALGVEAYNAFVKEYNGK